MERMIEPKGWETTAPADLMIFTSPPRRFIAFGSSSTRRVSMQVRMTRCLLGQRSVWYCSYSLRSTKPRLKSRMLVMRDMVGECRNAGGRDKGTRRQGGREGEDAGGW